MTGPSVKTEDVFTVVEINDVNPGGSFNEPARSV